jgi:hypothetical protein
LWQIQREPIPRIQTKQDRQIPEKESLMKKSILTELIKCDWEVDGKYVIIKAGPATGVLYTTEQSPMFLSGHLRMQGRSEGQYPVKYLEMIDYLFGPEQNTIEVCSRHVKNCFTVDINPDTKPSFVTDGQTLEGLESNQFNRWRCDPPYSEAKARKMYGTSLPQTSKLLTAGVRVCKPGALMFLLLGPQNFQWAPARTKRIGWIAMTIVPNQELRALHIYYKEKEYQEKLA